MIACVSRPPASARCSPSQLFGLPLLDVYAFVAGRRAEFARLAFQSLMQRHAPPEALGRVFVRYEVLFQLAWVVGAFVPALAADLLPAGIVILAVFYGALAAIYRVAPRRRARRSGRERRVAAELASFAGRTRQGGSAMAEFVTVGTADEVAEGEATAFEVEGSEIAVARVDGALYAFCDVCTHRGCNLSPAASSTAPTIKCECHGSVLDMRPARSSTVRPPSRRDLRGPEIDGSDPDRGLSAVTAQTFVVVGASLAGATAAATLRDAGLRRPAGADRRRAAACRTSARRLSKEYPARRASPARRCSCVRPTWCAEHAVEARLGVRVAGSSIPGSRRSRWRTSDDRLRPRPRRDRRRNRRFDVPGADLDGVFAAADGRRCRRGSAGRRRRRRTRSSSAWGSSAPRSRRRFDRWGSRSRSSRSSRPRCTGSSVRGSAARSRRCIATHGVGMRFHDAVERFEGDRPGRAGRHRGGRRDRGRPRGRRCRHRAQRRADDRAGDRGRTGASRVGPRARDRDPRCLRGGRRRLATIIRSSGEIRVEHFDNAIKMGEHAARDDARRDRGLRRSALVLVRPVRHQVQMAGVGLGWTRWFCVGRSRSARSARSSSTTTGCCAPRQPRLAARRRRASPLIADSGAPGSRARSPTPTSTSGPWPLTARRLPARMSPLLG